MNSESAGRERRREKGRWAAHIATVNWTAVAVEDTGAVVAVAGCCRRASRGPGGLLRERHGKPSRNDVDGCNNSYPCGCGWGVEPFTPPLSLCVTRVGHQSRPSWRADLVSIGMFLLVALPKHRSHA